MKQEYTFEEYKKETLTEGSLLKKLYDQEILS